MTSRVLLDTDLAMGQPGSDIDDGFALALAVADPEIQLELVTTVNGNTHVDNASRLTTELLSRLGASHVPVVRGAGAPLVRRTPRSPSDAERWSPAAGYDGPVSHAAVELAERIRREPGELTLVCIGPLTNVALALTLEPRIAEAVREVVVMGGVFTEQTGVGVMPGEFNFWVDPEAAAIVLASGAPLRFVGLDVTRKVRLSRDDADRLTASGGDFAAFAAACTQGWIDHLETTTPGDDWDRGSCALHDPLAMAVVSRPDLVTWRPAAVAVETASDRTRGVAVADLLGAATPPEANCRIGVAVDAEGFREHFLGRLATLP